MGGVVTLSGEGLTESEESWGEDTLYRPAGEVTYENKKLKWIPYFAWANRGEGEMAVWIRKSS